LLYTRCLDSKSKRPEIKIHHENRLFGTLQAYYLLHPTICSIKTTSSLLTFLTKRKEFEHMATIRKKGKKWQLAILKKSIKNILLLIGIHKASIKIDQKFRLVI